MHVSDYGDGYGYILNIFFFNEYIFELMAEDMNCLLLNYLALKDFFQEAIQIKSHLLVYFFKNYESFGFVTTREGK